MKDQLHGRRESFNQITTENVDKVRYKSMIFLSFQYVLQTELSGCSIEVPVCIVIHWNLRSTQIFEVFGVVGR